MACRSCGNRTKQIFANPRDFCATLSMASPVFVEKSTDGKHQVMVTTPGGDRTTLPEALARFSCKENGTTGLRLASLVITALHRAEARGCASSIPVGRQMPLLMLKDQLFKLVLRCPTCHGAGCPSCKHTGFAE